MDKSIRDTIENTLEIRMLDSFVNIEGRRRKNEG